MQTILGAGGAIGNELAKSLPRYTDRLRLVGRNPVKVNEGDELLSADLLDPDQVDRAVEGSSVVYLTVGLPYSTKTWEQQWPRLMSHVIDACSKHQAKLVFFDNIYMYDPAYLNGMKEDTPMRPSSRKGKVRKSLVDMINAAVDHGRLEAAIARSADFYGPNVKTVSLLSQTVIENLAAGKRAQVMGNPTKKHAFTFTPDAGKATALIGNTPDAFNQVWHLPTAKDPYTGEQWVHKFSDVFGTKPRYMAIGRGMLRLLGVFMPIMREFNEMLYQYETDYVFDSSKFEQRFDLKPTSYDEAIRIIAREDYGIS